jgi:hypothetical protein
MPTAPRRLLVLLATAALGAPGCVPAPPVEPAEPAASTAPQQQSDNVLQEPAPRDPATVGPDLPETTLPTPDGVEAAIRRGLAFLIESQRPDGSWGHHRPKGINVGMPVPMGHHGLRVAVTSLAVMALVETAPDGPAAEIALKRAEVWLLQNVPKLRVAALWAMFNNWGHAYSIQAIVRLLEHRPMTDARRTAFRRIVQDQIDRLCRRQHLDGGWGYYAWSDRTQRPLSGSMSFHTATILIAFHEAKEAGFTVPRVVVDRALRYLRKMRRPDAAFGYSWQHRRYPTHGINTRFGSLGRTQACNAALFLWGDEKTTPAVIRAWIRRLAADERWLRIIRKHNIPHAGYLRIAGYFYHYGIYYAAYSLPFLPTDERPLLAAHLARLILPHQEKDGSWWDFPLYDYHQQYGTAYALLTLNAYRRARRQEEPPGKPGRQEGEREKPQPAARFR